MIECCDYSMQVITSGLDDRAMELGLFAEV
jgi:hypothetical protein